MTMSIGQKWLKHAFRHLYLYRDNCADSNRTSVHMLRWAFFTSINVTEFDFFQIFFKLETEASHTFSSRLWFVGNEYICDCSDWEYTTIFAVLEVFKKKLNRSSTHISTWLASFTIPELCNIKQLGWCRQLFRSSCQNSETNSTYKWLPYL